jgi:hypothetical protein
MPLSPKVLIRLAAAVLVPGIGQAELPQSSPDVVVDAVRSCDRATGPQGVDVQVLRSDGWEKGSFGSKDSPVKIELAVYGRAGVMIFLNLNAKTSACVLAATVGDAKAQTKVLAKMSAAFGDRVSTTKDGQQVYRLASGNLAMVAATGTPKKAAVRIGVAYVEPEKK